YFQSLVRTDKDDDSSIIHARSVRSLPSHVLNRFSLSGALPLGSFALTRVAIDAIQSIWDTNASEICEAGISFGQLTIAGTAVPPSNELYLLPRKGPAGLCPLSNSSARSAYPSSTI